MSQILQKAFKELEPDAEISFNDLPQVVSSSGKRYYAKTGGTNEQEQYVGEAESLKHIAAAAPGLAPCILASGLDDHGHPYFISEYLDMSRHTSTSMTTLATRLATELHTHRSENGFGFGVPTFCGLTRLPNGWFDTWEECYDALIGTLEDGLRRKGYDALCEKISAVRKSVIPALLRPLKVEPVLLHGDLWSGNTGVNKLNNEPVLFDPSSFYGHNEADLAIARVFGGFPPHFYQKYHDLLPKTEPVDQYELRVDLYELFHYLNHALIFGGGGYSSSALQKMDRLLKLSPQGTITT